MTKTRSLCILVCMLLSLAPVGYGHSYNGDHVLPLLADLGAAFKDMLFVIMIVLTFDVAEWKPIREQYRRSAMLFTQAKPSPFVLIGFTVFLLWTIVNGYRAFQHYPSVIDSVAQYIHAKIFASGQVTVPAHPLNSFFQLEHFINEGHFFSQYPPGHIALLALGHLAHAPWLVNPLLGAGTCVLLYILARDLFSETVARLTLILAVASPFLRAMSSEFMNHATSLFCLTLFTLCFFRSFHRKNSLYGFVAGMSAGYCFITRPYTGLLYLVPFAIYGLWLVIRNPKDCWKYPCSMALGFLPVAFLQFLYNYASTGSPWLFGYILMYGKDHSPGFHEIPAHFAGQLNSTVFTLWDGITKGFNDLILLQRALFNWPMPSLIFIGAAFITRRRRAAPYLILFLSASLCVWIADVTYFYSDWCFGPRYLYESSGLLIILTAYGITQVPLIFRVVPCLERYIGHARIHLIMLIAGCILASIVSTNSTIINSFYCSAPIAIVPQLQSKELKHALVFVDIKESFFDREFDELAAYYFPPLDSNEVIVARDRGDRENLALMDYYPDRSVYRWEYYQKNPDRSTLEWVMKGDDTDGGWENLTRIRPPITGKTPVPGRAARMLP